jgi:predicted ATP-grasp superfamily ATP-dependent carboligase
VLVLDANQRSALAVTRSLGRHREIEVLAADETPTALAGSSKYCSRYLRYPSPATQPADFCRWLAERVAIDDIAMLFPTTEITSRLLLTQVGQLGSCKLPFADLDTVLALADKWKLVNLAEKLGIPHPRSQFFHHGEDFTGYQPAAYPVVVKPCLSQIWLGDRWLNSSVHIARSPAELQALIAGKSYLRQHPFMLQEFIPGHGAGVFALYDRGRPLTFFTHRRLREKPPAGGVSVLCESAMPDPRMLDMARRLLDAANWHGVAMVEFRVTPAGEPYLMEVNARFWGSLQLAIDAGIDFPHLLYRITNGEQLAEVAPYRIGQRLRWLLGDVDSLYLTLRDREQFSVGDKCRRLLDFLTPHPFSTRHEIGRLDDLGPAWFEVKQYLGALRG